MRPHPWAVTVVTRNISVHLMRWPLARALFHGNKHRMGACGCVSEALLRPRLGRVRCPCRGDKLHTEGGVPGALGPCSLRSADGLVIIISRPLSYLTTSPQQLLRRLLRNAPRTAIFLLVLCFVHNINLYCDPAPGSIHLCLTSGGISRWGFCFVFSCFFYFSSKSRLISEQEGCKLLILSPC